MMWRLVSCTFCLLLSLQPGFWSGWAAADELESEVKVEVLYKPLQCTQKSKKGDLMNIHYDGFLAKDGSQFYCRLVLSVKAALLKVMELVVQGSYSIVFDLTKLNYIEN